MLSKLCLPTELLQAFTILHTLIVIAILLWLKPSLYLSLWIEIFLAINLSLIFNIKKQAVNKTFDDYAILGMLPFLTIVYLSDLPSLNHSFVTEKDHLQITQITIPSQPTCTKNKRYNSCSFKANDMSFICNYDIRVRKDENCDSLYRYGDEQATVFYQPIDKTNLIYEIEFSSQKFYEFNRQSTKFQNQQNSAKKMIFWLLISFFMPSLFLYVQYFLWGRKISANAQS